MNGLSDTKKIFQFEPLVPEISAFNQTRQLYNIPHTIRRFEDSYWPAPGKELNFLQKEPAHRIRLLDTGSRFRCDTRPGSDDA